MLVDLGCISTGVGGIGRDGGGGRDFVAVGASSDEGLAIVDLSGVSTGGGGIGRDGGGGRDLIGKGATSAVVIGGIALVVPGAIFSCSCGGRGGMGRVGAGGADLGNLGVVASDRAPGVGVVKLVLRARTDGLRDADLRLAWRDGEPGGLRVCAALLGVVGLLTGTPRRASRGGMGGGTGADVGGIGCGCDGELDFCMAQTFLESESRRRMSAG